MGDNIPDHPLWTLDGDETSWAAWAVRMAQAEATPFLEALIDPYQTEDGGWALDLGCGTGRAFRPLVEAGYRVVGLDPIMSGVGYSQQRLQKDQLYAEALVASAAALPLATACVAFVLASSCLFHLSPVELASALQEIRRVLRPGGRAILHFLDIEDWRIGLASPVAPQAVPVPSYRAVVTCFCSERQIREWIEASGLQLTALALQVSDTEHGQQRNWLAHCTKRDR